MPVIDSPSIRSAGRTIGMVLVCGALTISCSGSSDEPDRSPDSSATPAYSSSIPSASAETVAARGTVVSSTTSTPFDPSLFPAGARAATMIYHSISGVDGRQTEVSGALFVPATPAPLGGYPIVAYAHGTVGISPGCAPSEHADLSGDAGIVSYFLGLGYAVAYTDYQGLSSTAAAPAHPYLEPRTAAFDVIDSVRAARALDPSLSTRWVAVGTSQGGHAAWAAHEFDGIYGDGLDLLGTAVLAPALDVSPLVADAQASVLSGGQRSLYPLIVEGAAAVDPDIEPTDHLHGALGDNAEALISCDEQSSAARTAADADVELGDTTAVSTEAAENLTSLLQQYALPRAASPTPVLAVYGGSDDIVRPQWTEAALDRACEFGDTVLSVRLEGQGHSVDPGSLLETWIADRFTGGQAPSNC